MVTAKQWFHRETKGDLQRHQEEAVRSRSLGWRMLPLAPHLQSPVDFIMSPVKLWPQWDHSSTLGWMAKWWNCSHTHPMSSLEAFTGAVWREGKGKPTLLPWVPFFSESTLPVGLHVTILFVASIYRREKSLFSSSHHYIPDTSKSHCTGLEPP